MAIDRSPRLPRPWKLPMTTALVLMLTTLPVSARRPNVILIMADDLGYEGLAANGGTSYETPRLDEIAASGMRFTQCYSQPVCTPSRVKIMTGRSNARNYRAFGVLIPEEVTFGNVMKEAGYKTCIAGKWQLSGSGPGGETHGWGTWPDQCGFEESCLWAYAHYLSPEDLQDYESTSTLGKGKVSRYWNPSIIENGRYRSTTIDDYGPDIFTQYILDFISRNRQEEFFVYYPMVLTHAPFNPTPDTPGLKDDIKFRTDSQYFGDMIRYTGKLIKQIIDRLDQLGIAENTLILFTSDNGTGRSIVSWMGDRLVLGGKALPIDAGVHVPMLAYWKGTVAAGTVSHDLIDFSDFLPTIAEVGQATLPADRVLDGRSFLPQLKGLRGNPRQAVLIHYDKDPTFREPKFRRVRFAFDGRFKLYLDGSYFEVPRDWDEQNPLDPGQLSGPAHHSYDVLRKALDSLPEWKPDNSFFKGQPDSETRKRLRKSRDILGAGQNTG